MYNHVVSFDDLNVIVSSNSEFHLKIRENLLISSDQPILNKSAFSIIFVCLVTVSYDYLVIINIRSLQFIFYCFQ